MHYTEITKKLLDQNLVQTDGKTPESTVNPIMSQSIKEEKDNSPFVRIGDGLYTLNLNIDKYKTNNQYSNESANRFIRRVTFHQSYSYEDFIEGIRPVLASGQANFELKQGLFKQIANDAKTDPSNNYVLLIDEINRGNISKIFGELITLIEDDKRGKIDYRLQLAYSKEWFTIPKNLFIIGTMNTADHSLTQIDTALRRRFAFVELMPDPKLLTKKIDGISLQDLLIKINQKIVEEGLREKQIGHSYFMQVHNLENLHFTFKHEIVPLLQDYFFDDYEKFENVMSNDFVDSKNMLIKLEWQTDLQKFFEILKSTFQL